MLVLKTFYLAVERVEPDFVEVVLMFSLGKFKQFSIVSCLGAFLLVAQVLFHNGFLSQVFLIVDDELRFHLRILLNPFQGFLKQLLGLLVNLLKNLFKTFLKGKSTLLGRRLDWGTSRTAFPACSTSGVLGRAVSQRSKRSILARRLYSEKAINHRTKLCTVLLRFSKQGYNVVHLPILVVYRFIKNAGNHVTHLNKMRNIRHIIVLRQCSGKRTNLRSRQ